MQTDSKKTIVINGNNFSNLEQFYVEVDRVLTKDLGWRTGHNLDAFNDLLCGGFGVFGYDESIRLVWENSAKSKNELTDIRQGQTVYEILLEIIKSHEHIDFEEA